MGMRSRRKGYRVENELANALTAAGVPTERVPLSGSAGGAFAGDLVLNPPGGRPPLRGEVKARGDGDGFKLLGRWLAGNDVLFLRRDKAPPLVVLPLDRFVRLLLDGPDPQPIPVAPCNAPGGDPDGR